MGFLHRSSPPSLDQVITGETITALSPTLVTMNHLRTRLPVLRRQQDARLLLPSLTIRTKETLMTMKTRETTPRIFWMTRTHLRIHSRTRAVTSVHQEFRKRDNQSGKPSLVCCIQLKLAIGRWPHSFSTDNALYYPNRTIFSGFCTLYANNMTYEGIVGCSTLSDFVPQLNCKP